ncbi:beta-ketoacyl synthase N-terminal-like domain-containing protein [Streptomyces jumonjinensis]|uniref:beta-ketoacyl synthase N-terminal-like domain-containing protein n=1 Tax=Streptomyces jumonjinensis TaxID=1945 RepID=UPI0037A31F66
MTRPVISAWSAVSPFGAGSAAFAHGVTAGLRAVAPLGADSGPLPQTHAAPVPDFDARRILGRKGTRSLDRVGALALAALGELLAGAGRVQEIATGERAGLVLGTTLGSAASMMDITRDTLTRELPYFVDAARIPNAVMNSAAAQCAIRHGIRGPNTTVAGGRSAGLLALRYAMRLLAAGRAGAVLCGGAEELTRERSWLEHHAHRGAERPLGEGCALLLVEPPAAPGSPAAHRALAEVLAVETRTHVGGPLADATAACLRRALTRGGVTAGELWAVSPSGEAAWERAVDAECARGAGGRRPVRLPDDTAWGDAGAATAAFQIASALAAAEHDPAARGRVAAITSFDREGVLACALLRIHPYRRIHPYGTKARTDHD